MSRSEKDLNGSAPDKCQTALLLVDVINQFDFPEADMLLRHALPMAKALRTLTDRARRKKVPVIYSNDNFGRWQSDFRSIVQNALSSKGSEVVQKLRPKSKDYFVLKPKHSAFFSTSLELLLAYLGTKKLIITGMASNICVLFTANDAYMRDFRVIIPEDCVCANTEAENRHALDQMKKTLKARICQSREVQL